MNIVPMSLLVQMVSFAIRCDKADIKVKIKGICLKKFTCS